MPLALFMSLLHDAKRLEKRALPEVRQSIADKVCKGYIRKTFCAEEIPYAEEVMRLLASDPAPQVRQVVASNLAMARQAPHDIILRLAQDSKEVAVPLLRYSRLLKDDDLIAIIKKRKETAINVAIVMRERVSYSVSSVLISTHIKEVVISLLMNKGAEISDHGYHDIMDEFHSDHRILALMIERGDLSTPIIQKLFKLLPESLKVQLCSLYHLDRRALYTYPVIESDEILIDSLIPEEEAHISEEQAWLHNSIAQYVGYLYRQGQLTPSTLLRSLYEGNILFFERAIARLAELPVAKVEAIIKEEKSERLRLLCQKASIPKNLYEAMMVLLKFAFLQKRHLMQSLKEMEGSTLYKKQLIEYITAYGYEQTIPLMPYIKALICTHLNTENLMASWGGMSQKYRKIPA